MATALLRAAPDIARPCALWDIFIVKFLDASPKLARELWRVYTAMYPADVHTMVFNLRHLVTRAASHSVAEQRCQMLHTVVPPELLLALTRQLSPEGSPRRRDVVDLEERILWRTANPDTWR